VSGCSGVREYGCSERAPSRSENLGLQAERRLKEPVQPGMVELRDRFVLPVFYRSAAIPVVTVTLFTELRTMRSPGRMG
jgi:hypothetical protein